MIYNNGNKVIQMGGVNQAWDASQQVYQYFKPSSGSPTPPAHDYSQDYLTFEAISAGTFAFTNACSYSLDDGTTWTALAANTSTPTVSAGNKIMFKANITTDVYSGVGRFSSTGTFNAMGNPLSLMDEDDFGSFISSNDPYAYYRLFSGCTGLVSAENLFIPSIVLNHSCEEMFSNCTSLTVAPALPATTLLTSCYEGMFRGCSALTTAPELPAESISLNNYSYMFSGCTSLNYIKCLAVNFSHNPTQDWLSGVAATGTFVKHPSADWSEMPSGFGIPTGWTVVDAS